MEQRWFPGELPPAISCNIYDLFSGRIFVVPDYQRNYAWKEKHWTDFWNDIKEGLSTRTFHYWGQITLRDIGETVYCKQTDTTFRKCEIVDGQQRLATLYLFLLGLSNLGRPGIKETFIKCEDIYRLELGGLNKQFLKDLVDGRNPLPNITTNLLLRKALDYFEGELRAYGDLSEVSRYLQHITFLTRFALSDETLAVKAFQSLNDRGKPLTLLDKTKSFLMFYSIRYLEKRGLKDINNAFGNIFTNYDLITEVGLRENVGYMKYLYEDELLRLFYHYIASYVVSKCSIAHWYFVDIGANDVFESFLKGTCAQLKDNPARLEEFIKEFMENFDEFVIAFRRVADRIRTDPRYKKFFCFLDGGPNARVYPLIIALETRELLDDFLNIIETLDLRIYKVRGGDPRAILYNNTISKIKEDLDTHTIRTNLIDFVNSYIPDPSFRNILTGSFYPNPGIKYILWEFEKHRFPSFDEHNYTLYNAVQIEHIFPQHPRPSFPSYGFQNEDEYVANLNRIGNLCLLEEEINKSKKTGNKEPPAKANEYLRSQILGTRELGHYIANHGFTKNDIEGRNREIIRFCLERWPVS